MINAPIRDANWATMPAVIVDTVVEETGTSLRIDERFTVTDGALDGHLVFEAEAAGRLRAELALTAKRDVVTNRAGFTLLHPIAGVAGTKLSVRHGDGSREETRFPALIAPGQPAFDIVGLAHTVDGVSVDIAFDGEIFEMEDQRNWSDASFKTYCRPLSLPTPYTLGAGETVRQRIEVTMRAVGHAPRPPASAAKAKVALPSLGLACEPDGLGHMPQGARAVLRFQGTVGWTDDALKALSATIDQVDVEIILADGESTEPAVRSVKAKLDDAGLDAAHVIALPEAYLKSYQPSGPWPTGLSPDDCAEAARTVFPDAKIGGGMLTHFTEFNRHPPTIALADDVTFGNSAVVHAADDLSVWETLEALPAIFASAQALAGDLPIRLGLMSIAMRTNPYGDGLVANPGGQKLAMTGDDPRQGEVFAAAYAVAAFALAAGAGVEMITLAAPAGRFGLIGPEGPRPMARAVEALLALGPNAELERTPTSLSLTSPAGRITAHLGGQGRLEIDGLESTHGR